MVFSSKGFTLVELVVTIVIIGILSSLGGMFISRPIEGYIDLERRTELVDQAEMALRRMQRDIRAALPNSVREIRNALDTKTIGIEFLHVVDGGRYRRAVDPVYAVSNSAEANKNILKFTSADKYFEVLGGLKTTDYSIAGCLCVIYNLTADKDINVANAYAQSYPKKNTEGIDNSDDSTGKTFITLDIAKKFPLASPYQRFFIVDEAVSYIIDSGTGELRRYSGYIINQSPVGPDDLVNDVSCLVANYLQPESNFTYDSGTTTSRSGLVTIQLALEDTDRAAGERITLLHQVHVDNAP